MRAQKLFYFFRKMLIICINYNLELLYFPITKKKKKKPRSDEYYVLEGEIILIILLGFFVIGKYSNPKL